MLQEIPRLPALQHQASAQGRLSQPNTVDVWGQIIPCHGGRHCRKSSSISDLYTVKVSSTPSSKLQQPKMFPDVATCLLEVRTTGPQVLLTTDVPSSRDTATGRAPPAACRPDSAGDREGRAGLSAAHLMDTRIHTAPGPLNPRAAHQRSQDGGSPGIAFSCPFCR